MIWEFCFAIFIAKFEQGTFQIRSNILQLLSHKAATVGMNNYLDIVYRYRNILSFIWLNKFLRGMCILFMLT